MFFLLHRLVLIILTLIITPILMVLGATLLFFNLVHLITRFTRQRLPAHGPELSGLASIIILNWNGRDLLAEGLPSVIEAVRVDGRPHEILLVDNGSTDGSIAYVRAAFPGVRILSLPENLGFAEGNNAGVRAARHDIVVLLNNDMIVDPGFLRPLLEQFRPRTFAVSSQIFLQNSEARREETGKTTALFRRGMIDYSHCPVEGKTLPRAFYPAFWAGGGSSAFHRERYLGLGGFQDIFSPAYVEDADLSYQAWKVGWEVLFAPASVVYHKHRASSNRRFTPPQLQTLILRNQFVFIWKNVRSWRYMISHCFWLPWNCYRLARDFGPAIWRSWIQAALRLPALEIARLGAPFRGVRSDPEIFELFQKPGLFFAQERQTDYPPAMPCPRHEIPAADEERLPRILWLTAYLPHLGRHAGAGRMYQLLKRIARHYRVTLLTFLEADEERQFLPQVEPLCEKVIAMRRRPPLRWQLSAYEPFEEFRTPEMAAALAEQLENRDFNLIQLEYSQMGCYADRSYGLPILLTKHEVDFAACLRRAAVERHPWGRVRWFYNYLQVLDREIRLTRRADAAICMVADDAKQLGKFCKRIPIHVINTGVDLDYFAPNPVPPIAPRMIFVGAFQHFPNVDAMLFFCSEILPRIKAQIPEVELWIVGSGPPPSVISLGEIPGVLVTGYVDDIRPYMAASSVYVVPLRLGVGIRGKILEAWGMSSAIVATPVACAGLQYQDGQNLLLAESPSRFAEKSVALLKSPELRRSLGMEGRKTAEKLYSWDSSAQQLEELYRSFITGPQSSGKITAQKANERSHIL